MAVEIHVDDAGVGRNRPAPFGKLQAVGLDGTLRDTNRAEATDPARITQQFVFDGQAFFAVLVETIRGRRSRRAGSMYSSHPPTRRMARARAHQHQ